MDPIVIKVENVNMCILSELPKDVRDEIRSTLSYIVPGFQFMPSYKKAKIAGQKPWDGTKTCALYYVPQQTWLKIPTGLLSYVRKILDQRGIPYDLQDERIPAVQTPGYSLEGLTLRDYQAEVMPKILNRQRGVLKMATGSGKSPVMVNAIVQASCFPAIFYVTSCDLLEQAYDQFRRYVRFNGQPAEIGRIGSGHCDIKPITVATIQSAQLALEGKFDKFDDETNVEKMTLDEKQKSDIRDLVQQAQFVFCDEVQHAACSTLQSILFNSPKARFRIGGSASPWRDDGLDLLIEAYFGRYLCDIPASYLIKRGYLIKPRIVFNHFRQTLGMAANFNAHYSAYVTENSARNNWIADRAKFHLDKGRPTIILVKWVSHAETLAPLIPNCEILAASGSSHKTPKKRKELLDRMRKRELMCIIGTSLLDEGVDIPSASVGIFAGGGKSSTRALQRVGRFIRRDEAFPDKSEAFIEEFYDHTKWLKHHSDDRRRILETEPEFEISDNKATLAL